MEPTPTRLPLPKIAWVAVAIALLSALFLIAPAFFGQIIVLPLALIPLIAAVGIARRNVWSARGYAVFQMSGIVAALLIYWRTRTALASVDRISFIVALLWGAIEAALFWFTARSLAKAQGKPGRPYFWIAVSALMVLPWFFVQVFRVPSVSMENTLLAGDSVVVQSWPAPAVSRGDVVVFPYPLNPREDYIKRVVGVPGDRIRIVNKALYRNGAPVNEPYAKHMSYIDAYRDNFPSQPNLSLPAPAHEMIASDVINGEVVVPAGKYFVLGDNRDDSSDSRYWGFVDASTVLGKPAFIYNSVDQPASLAGEPSSSGHTRWNRLFRIVR